MAAEHFSYTCQQCKQPFQLDTSLEDLSPSAYDMIAGSLPQPPTPLPASPPTAKTSRLPSPALSPKATNPNPNPNPNPAESFVLLQESVLQAPGAGRGRLPVPSKRQAAQLSLPALSDASEKDKDKEKDKEREKEKEKLPSPPAPRAHNLRHLHRLFDLLSSRTDATHPLCAECTHALMDGLNKQLEEARRERDGYIAFEREAKRELERGRGGVDAEQGLLAKLLADERAAVAELRTAEAELGRLDQELLALGAEEAELEREEAAFWAQHASTQIASSNLRTALSSLRGAMRTSERELDALERTNVYDDAFCLGSDGVFGTINGLRLGRAGTVVVEWSEINAAWGQTVLLLHTLARKLEFTFDGWVLHPMGSFSRLARLGGNNESYELYGSTDIVVTRLLHNRRFDYAMVAFLDCLRQITEHAKRLDPSLDFYYPISKDRIGDASVKLQFSQEEAWTKAMRYILVVLKRLLRWVVNMDT
ncbi:APG6-domain-containing protein [Calocera viscosa TUFC12733]|uniref:APG6-domain-containing protein n=1 Tax=Calocera viscosa (strain TUFC12733) TaxID=1330018 RepID=A0A167PNS7_CALVF|nr:APG6-domain-containing protein [Calocera viscosa TUFC12733]